MPKVHRITLTLPDHLDARFAQALETGVKKATVITNALDLSLPRARKISKRK